MIDFLIVIAFIIYAISSGFRSKEQASENLEEYFLAGRSIEGWRAGFSMAATQFAADTPLLATGLIATGGIFMLWRLWIYGLAFLLMGFILSASWRRSGVLTDAELTEIRYSGRATLGLRVLKAIYYGTVINCIVLAMVLVAAMRIAEVFLPWHEWIPTIHAYFESIVVATGLDFGKPVTDISQTAATANNLISILTIIGFTATYSTTGGLRSVIATDVVQFMLGLVGTAAYAWYVIAEVGGVDALGEKMVEIYGQVHASEMLAFSPSSDDALYGFFLIIGLQWFFQMNSDGTGYLAQRSMACKTDRQARIAAVLFTWLQIVARSLFWLLIAVGLLVIYPFAAGDMGSETFTASREILFVTGVNDLLPPGIRGLMLTGLLAALASTVDTHLNWGASYWSNDVYDRFICQARLKREPTNTELVLVARISNLVIVVIALIIMANLGSIQAAWQISLIFGAGMGAVLVMRWLWERINLYSELAAMATSLFVAPLIVFGPNIARLYSGLEWGTPIESISDPAVVELVTLLGQDWFQLATMAFLSTAAAIGVTYFTPATERDVLESFYVRVRPMGFWQKTASQLGQDRLEPIKRLLDGGRLMLTCGASVFLLLVGLGKIFIHLPGEGIAWGITFCVAGLLITPLWIKGVFAFEDVEAKEKKAAKLRAALEENRGNAAETSQELEATEESIRAAAADNEVDDAPTHHRPDADEDGRAE